MKKLCLLIVFHALLLNVFAQDSMDKVTEKRAREMHRVIGLSDKEQWKKFIKENYTQALIDKPMTAKIETSERDDAEPSTKVSSANNLEEKAKMFQQLHNDFGNSKILSIKPDGEKLEMILQNKESLKGTFQLRFEKKSPYLIDGLGIEVLHSH